MISFFIIRGRLIVFLLCFICNYSIASDKVQVKAEPLWLFRINVDLLKKPATKSISSGYYLELADHQVNLVNNTEYRHIIRHIINETGVQNASEVSVKFSPAFQQVVYHKVRLIRNGIVISDLKASQIQVVQEETDASDFQYNGLKRAFVLLSDVRKDDRIEFSYSIIGFNPVFANKYSDKIYFSSATAICNYFETIIVPQNRKLSATPFNKASKPVEQLQGDLRVYHWENPNSKIWESQPGVPSWFDDSPFVSITEYDNWQAVVNWGLSIFNNYQYRLPAALNSKIAKWRITANGDKDIFASLAIQFVQDQVRYLGLEMGTNTHQPYSPEEVYRRRFGDCKDKALLLATILQQENIIAYVALVNTQLKEKLLEAAPATNQFDHAIVAIKRSADYMYVDPTLSGQRGELVNLYVPAYGYALVVRKGEYGLQHIEPGFLNEISTIETLDAKFKDTSRFNVVTTYAGGRADNFRSSLANLSTSELELSYTQYYAKAFDGIEQAAPVAFDDDSLQNEVTVKEAYSIPALWHTDEEGKEIFEVFAQSVYDQIPNPSVVFKNAPIALAFPSATHYTLQINMPETWQFPTKELHIKNDFFQFDFVPVLVDSRINLRYFFKTFKDHIPQSELSKYKDDYKKILKTLEFRLSWSNLDGKSSEPATGKINWLMGCFAFLLVTALAILFRYLNKLRIDVQYSDEPAWPIGGWLIVLGISLLIGGLSQIVSFDGDGYFKNSVWQVLGESGGFKLQLVLVAELGFTLVCIGGNLSLLYWYICRRDIFPRIFICYVATLLTGQLSLILLYNVAPSIPEFAGLQTSVGTQFIRTCIYAAVWITYMIRSERVKSTFVK